MVIRTSNSKRSESRKNARGRRKAKGRSIKENDARNYGKSHVENYGFEDSRVAIAVKNLVQSRKRDIWTAVMFVLGIISALSIYLDTTGAFGDFIDSSTGNIFGILRFVIPSLLILIGILLIFPKGLLLSKMGKASKQDGKEEATNEGVSGTGLIVGSILIGIAIAGIIQISSGNPVLTPLSESTEELRSAGGFLGAVVGIPLVAAMESVASIIVLIGVGILGLSIATSSHIGQWFRFVGAIIKKLRERPVRELSQKPTNDLKEKQKAKTSKENLKRDPVSASSNASAGSTGEASGGLDPLIANGQTIKEEEKVGKVKKVKKSTPLVSAENLADKNLADKKPKEKAKSLTPQVSITKINTQGWILPSLDLLKRAGVQKSEQEKTRLVEEQSVALTGALESHGVEATLTGWVVGPTVTRYELELDDGVKVSSITKLNKDISYAMAARDVRILAPIPGRRAIGIEVPNHDREIVLLGDNLASKEAAEAKHPLEVALGKDINGTTVMMNLAETPHILIAGATGSGKSSCLNVAVTSLLMRCSPDEVRLILVDPKMVEMRQFENAPHLLTPPVVNPKKAANALGWAVREMDRRYETLFRAGFRENIGYNQALANKTLMPKEGEENYEHMPYIVVVIDELADLMMIAAKSVEDYICRLAQKARAVGIHLIVATQRPSTDVITGVIKANIPARLAFSVSSLIDSRVILDQQGAERLVGQGDMLLRLPSMGTILRVQGAWISEEEVKKVVEFWSEQKPEPDYIQSITEDSAPTNNLIGGDRGNSNYDELYEMSKDLVISSGLGSASMLQRKLRIGFARAGRLIDMLEENGVVGPPEGSKPREVLIISETLTN